jgi:hypothetical protein
VSSTSIVLLKEENKLDSKNFITISKNFSCGAKVTKLLLGGASWSSRYFRLVKFFNSQAPNFNFQENI